MFELPHLTVRLYTGMFQLQVTVLRCRTEHAQKITLFMLPIMTLIKFVNVLLALFKNIYIYIKTLYTYNVPVIVCMF